MDRNRGDHDVVQYTVYEKEAVSTSSLVSSRGRWYIITIRSSAIRSNTYSVGSIFSTSIIDKINAVIASVYCGGVVLC